MLLSYQPIWPGWEAPDTVVTIRTILRGVPRGPSYGLARGGGPHNAPF